MDNMLKEDLKILDELLRTAYDLISPISHHDDLKFLTTKSLEDGFKKNPSCYLKMTNGRGHTLFPICNRAGIKCTKMMAFSKKLATAMHTTPDTPMPEGITVILKKLDYLMSRYKSPSTPLKAAARKGMETKKFNSKMG